MAVQSRLPVPRPTASGAERPDSGRCSALTARAAVPDVPRRTWALRRHRAAACHMPSTPPRHRHPHRAPTLTQARPARHRQLSLASLSDRLSCFSPPRGHPTGHPARPPHRTHTSPTPSSSAPCPLLSPEQPHARSAPTLHARTTSSHPAAAPRARPCHPPPGELWTPGSSKPQYTEPCGPQLIEASPHGSLSTPAQRTLSTSGATTHRLPLVGATPSPPAPIRPSRTTFPFDTGTPRPSARDSPFLRRLISLICSAPTTGVPDAARRMQPHTPSRPTDCATDRPHISSPRPFRCVYKRATAPCPAHPISRHPEASSPPGSRPP